MSESNDYIRQRDIPLEVKIRTLVKDIRFNVVGTVSKVSEDGTRIDVTLPYLDCNMQPIILKGIEILRPGTHAIIIKYKPVVGDVALVFAMKDYWAEGQFNHQPEKQVVKAEPYSNVTMKAILVQTNEDNSDATIIDVKDDEIAITAPLKTNITCKDAVTITAESTTDITCKDAVTITAESTTDITCKDAVTVTSESTTDITCKDAVTITAESTTAITCKDDATVDASGKNVSVKAAKVTVNEHLTVE